MNNDTLRIMVLRIAVNKHDMVYKQSIDTCHVKQQENKIIIMNRRTLFWYLRVVYLLLGLPILRFTTAHSRFLGFRQRQENLTRPALASNIARGKSL